MGGVFIYKIGLGFDAHPFTEGRKLIIGGVCIDYEFGLLGHSDADVLIHAVIDAIAGICLNKDKGVLFPDSDPAYKGANSIDLLRKTAFLVDKAGYKVCNIDSTIIAQIPKFTPYIHLMRENIAKALNIETADVSVKATTTEYLGFTGRKEGIAAVANALVIKKQL
ncbi:MAG: 2-C-methyl-D-erythritol 2,4-cyclodiphosphate synthase [Deferribacteraceae bacterium]|jgi:2-C-methyl-D-erythritol 2,4-cyclodiphosphate synthase|nr:2-C-methyl-D-erythritol 2,4-cyclodiphosphate synthase [Deferribacteraceae bacterium]